MKIIFFILAFLPALSHAKNYGCATPGASMESTLFDRLSTDLKIDTSTVDEMKAKVEIIDISPITELYAESLARIDYDKDPDINKNEVTFKHIYFSSYYDNNVKIITAKYTYFNKQKKKSVFIASSLMNDDECSIRFNGYLTLSREF